MLYDLTLEAQSGGLYKLGAPSSDETTRLTTRVIIQELSELLNGRGSAFINMLKAGRIKTSSDVTGMFTAATAGIIQNLQTYSYGVGIQSIVLLSYTQVDATTLSLKIAVTGNFGSATVTIPIAPT